MEIKAEIYGDYRDGLINGEQYCRSLTKEMVDAFLDGVAVHEDGSLKIHLAYDDMLCSLQGMAAEREAEQDGE